MSANTHKNAKQCYGASGQPSGSSRNEHSKPPFAAAGQPKGGIIAKKPRFGTQGQQSAHDSRSAKATRPVVAD